jgi:hypothetical protein
LRHVTGYRSHRRLPDGRRRSRGRVSSRQKGATEHDHVRRVCSRGRFLRVHPPAPICNSQLRANHNMYSHTHTHTALGARETATRMPVTTIKTPKKRGKAAPPRFTRKLPTGHAVVPGRDGNELSMDLIEIWGACHGCGCYGHFKSNCPKVKKARKMARTSAADTGRVLDDEARMARLRRFDPTGNWTSSTLLPPPQTAELEDTACCVCLDDVPERQDRCYLHSGQHWVCKECVRKNLIPSTVRPLLCPMCREELDESVLGQLAEEEGVPSEKPAQKQNEQPRQFPSEPRTLSRRTSSNNALIGQRVEVLFNETEWFAGTVREFLPAWDKHLVKFDDGDQRRLKLDDELAEGQLRWL